MDDLSLHVLDILENSTAAGATAIDVRINEDIAQNRLIIEIEDNGKGMDEGALSRSRDPFFTTRSTRRVGLGLSMLDQACKEAGGSLEIRSAPGQGTMIKASLVYHHIDRKPMGSMADTIVAFIAGSAGAVRLVYRHCRDSREFVFDTDDVMNTLDGVALNHPEILSFMKDAIESGLRSLSERSDE
jgi:hypothetical protein